MNHVYPINDWFPHELTLACRCHPQWNGTSVVHNAFDGREKFEALAALAGREVDRWNAEEFVRFYAR